MDRSVKILWIIVSGILLIAGIAIGTAFTIDSLRERTLLRSERELEGTVLLIARHFDQQFEDYVDAQALLAARLEIADAASPADFKKQLSNDGIHQLLVAEVFGSSNSNAISIFDSDGLIIASSQDGPLPTLNVSGRQYFKAFKSNATSATTLVEPVQSYVTGKPTTVIARRLTNSHGVFLGIMTRGLAPSKFDRFFESVARGTSSTITMAHRSGELLARFPRLDQMVGKNLGPEFQQAIENSGNGTKRMNSPVDGSARLAASRQLLNFPIVIVATTTPAVALAEWREQTRLLIIVACLLTIVIVSIFLLIGWRLSKERKSSQQRLAIGKQRLNTALTNMSQGLCLFDADRKLVISNPRFREIYKLTEQQVKPGTTVEQMLQYHIINGDTFDFPIKAHFNLGTTASEQVCPLGDGRVISIRQMPTPDGGWVLTHADISERERAATILAEQLAELMQVRNRLEAQKFELIATAEALRVARDEAEAASRSKSDFLAMMSHEIRTPMAGMMGMIELLGTTSLDAEQHDLAAVAQESARNLLTVVNNILDFSKLEAGQLTPESIPFSVKHSIDGVASLLGPKARNQGLRLETAIAEGIPVWLNGDPSRLGQILLNLVGNAIKFTEQGSIRIEASHWALEGDMVELRIEVIDTGAGIPADVQASLFNPFTQADTSVSRKYGGTGLGLAICKQLCLTMGGAIGVESDLGEGSKFWFTVRCTLGQAPEVIAPSLQPAIEPGAKTLNILIVEDNAIIRKLMSKLLAKRGYQADLTCNGRQALDAVQRKSYDLVLMDMQMPEMDGISAALAIRSLAGPERKVPILALTANALVGQREVCLAAGMNSFLTKPIQPDALYAAIDKWGSAKSDRPLVEAAQGSQGSRLR